MHEEAATCPYCSHTERGDDAQLVQDELADHVRREHPDHA